MADWPHPSSNQAYMYAKPLHLISFTYRRMHIYPWQMDPQLTIDPCYTVNPRSFTYYRMHIYPWQIEPPANQPYTHATQLHFPLPIDHRSMLHLPCQLTIDPCNTVTPHKSHIVHNAHIPVTDPYTKAVSHIGECYGRQTPQLRIDALNTITPNLSHLLADLPPQSIEHRCLEYCYTKLGRSTATEGVLHKRPFTHKGNCLILLFALCMHKAYRVKIHQSCIIFRQRCI